MIGAVGCPAKKGADHIIKMSLSQEWRGHNDFFMYNPDYTLCAHHTSALPARPGRETWKGIFVRPQQPSGAVFAPPFTGVQVGPEKSLTLPSSGVCRGQGHQAW